MIIRKHEQEYVVKGEYTDFWSVQSEIDRTLTEARKAFREKGGKVMIRIEIEHETDE